MIMTVPVVKKLKVTLRAGAAVRVLAVAATATVVAVVWVEVVSPRTTSRIRKLRQKA